MLDTSSLPCLHSGSARVWWEVPMSLLVPEPWPAHPGTGTGQCNSPAWSPGSMKVTRDETDVSPTCSFTLKQMREKYHLLRGRGNCHREQSRADWNGRTQNSSFSTTKSRGKCLPTRPVAKSVLRELSHLGPTCKKGGLQPFCWSSPL